MNFFLKKQLIKFSCTYQPFHSAKFYKNSYSRFRVMRMCHFRAQNSPFVLNKIFLVQTIIITFIYLLTFFYGLNFKKILTADLELWGCAIFGPEMVQLCQTNFFLEKITNIIFIYLLATFIVQNFKNSYSGSRVVRMRHFWAQNGAFAPNKNFFGKNYQYHFHLPIGHFHCAKF